VGELNFSEDVEVHCPHCGEPFAIAVETGFPHCEMIEDCAVCCRPIRFLIRCEAGEVTSLEALPA